MGALKHVLRIKTAVPLNSTKRNGKELTASTFLPAMARIEQQRVLQAKDGETPYAIQEDEYLKLI